MIILCLRFLGITIKAPSSFQGYGWNRHKFALLNIGRDALS